MALDDQRDLVLARVRAALGSRAAPAVASRSGVTSESKPLPIAFVAPGAAPGGMVASFTQAAEEAQAMVSVVESFDAARQRVGEILASEGVGRVLVSPDAADEPWRCGSFARGDDAPTITGQDQTIDVRRVRIARAEAAEVGVTAATFGLADTGTLVLCASPEHHRLDSLLPPVHVALVQACDLLPGLPELFDRLSAEQGFARHSAITFVRGPSRTADIELTLTIGVHGPCKLFIVVVEEVRRG